VTAPPTVCHLAGEPGPPVVVAGAPVARAELEHAARSYARGVTEQGYRPGSLFLVNLRATRDLVELSLGAWWAGMTVCVPPGLLTGLERDRTALVAGAAMQVCDAGDIVDEEHIRHRDVPAMPPEELKMAPVHWAPRCSPESAACVPLAGSGDRAAPLGRVTHSALLARLAPPAEAPGPDGPPVPPAMLAAMAPLVAGSLVRS
jgi:hypothetical protein